MRHSFLGWGEGSTWGSPFAQLFAGLEPVPMIHLGTDDEGRAGAEAITPAQIALGRGDGYLVALNAAVAAYGGALYVRVLGEMNNPRTTTRRRDRTEPRRAPRTRPPHTSRRSAAPS